MVQGLDSIEETITKSSVWESVSNFLGQHIDLGKNIRISILDIFIVFAVIFITSLVLRFLLRIITRNLPEDDKSKFDVVYGYFKWLIYLIIFLVTLHTVGIDITTIFAASAALLIGIGLALQTLFKDIISGISIMLDQTLHVGDIVELEGKIGKVEEIKLRTTRTVTIDNRVLIIPNHLFLENSLYNWTQNGNLTRENVTVGVAYGSDVQLVKKLLIQAASTHPDVISEPEPTVLFMDFGDSSLNFKLIFTLTDSFRAAFPKSDIRFEIDRLFREHDVTIPFPQRDVYIKQQ